MDTVTDLETALWHFARPLPEDRREAFCRVAWDTLTRLDCPGPGLIHRTLAGLLPSYFVPPPGDYSAGGAHRHRRFSKLASGAPVR
jgi:hypothetical protein